MKPSNILASDDFLINTGTGIRENFYQNSLRKYIKFCHPDLQDFPEESEIERRNIHHKRKSEVDLVISKLKLNRKIDLLLKRDNYNSIFLTEDNNLNFNKILTKEKKIRRQVFGGNYEKKTNKIYDYEDNYEMPLPPFYAWVHLSCVLFTPELYHTNQGLVKLNRIDKNRFKNP